MSAPEPPPLPPSHPRLPTYADVLGALANGHAVRVLVRYAMCIMTVQGRRTAAVPDSAGGLEIKTWEHFARGAAAHRNQKAYLSASETVLNAHPRHGSVLHHVRLRIYEDDSVLITTRYLKPDTYEVVMAESFEGRLSGGDDVHGVSCFLAD